MRNVQILFFLLGVTLAYGAAIDNSFYFDEIPDDGVKTMTGEIIDYDAISPSTITLEDNKGIYAFSKTIAKVLRKVLLMVSMIDVQTLRNLAQFVVSFISTYWGPYSQIIMPMLSGVGATLLRSMTS